jgi:uncharacterized protein
MWWTERMIMSTTASTSVYAIPVLDRWLIHAPLHSVTALVNEAALVSLLTGQAETAKPPLPALAAQLGAKARTAPGPPAGEPQPEFLGLITTRACNLRCAYCAFGADQGSGAPMRPEIVRAAIDWMARRMRAMGRETLAVHFFGGEALCAPEAVEVAVHYARAVAAERDLVPRLEVATNGCMDAEWSRFVRDHFDAVVLSIDGPPAVQDRQRPFKSGRGTFDRVSAFARGLAGSRTELSLRLTVTDASVATLAEIADDLCRNFRPNSIVFEPLCATSFSRSAGMSPPTPLEWVRACVAAFRVARQHAVRPVYAPASVREVRHSFCPVGRDSAIVGPEGQISACYMLEGDWSTQGLDLDFGRVEPDGEVTISEGALGRIRALTVHGARCQRCFARWHCGGGCHVRLSAEAREAVDTPFCIQTRLLVACELLETLGQGELGRRLIDNAEASMAAAMRATDRIADWRVGRG